jgi:hypothetical protein
MANLVQGSVVTEEKSTLAFEDIKQLPATVADDFEAGDVEKVKPQDPLHYGLDGAFVAKAQLFSDSLNSIGMTKWQYQMWAVCGFGWIVDNIAGYGLSVTYTPVGNEFVITNVALTGISYNIGAFVGALFW